MTADKRILILSSREGHASLGQAAYKYLKKLNLPIAIEDASSDMASFQAYKFIYRFTPSLFKIPFKIAQYQQVRRMLNRYLNLTRGRRIDPLLKKYRPALVMSVYSAYLPFLDQVKPEAGFKLINFITDPITIHPILYSLKADYNLGFDDRFVKLGRQLGIKPNQLKPIGWLTRPEFFDQKDQSRLFRTLNFDPQQLTLVVCGGSEGSNAIIQLLPILFLSTTPRPLQIIFITGHYRALIKIIKSAYWLAVKVNPKPPRVHIIGFTRRLADYLDMADVVIGKAGPNLIFESVAKGKPFAAISHISGQEDGNLDLIREYDIGWVVENPTDFKTFFLQLIKQPDRSINQKKPGINKLRAVNQAAGGRLIKIAQELLSLKT